MSAEEEARSRLAGAKAAVLEEEGASDWKLEREEGGVRVWSRKNKHPVKAWKVQMRPGDFSLQRFLEAFWDYEQRRKWDVVCAPTSRTLKELDERTQIRVDVTEPALGGAISERNFLNVFSHEKTDDSVTFHGVGLASSGLVPDFKPNGVLGTNYPNMTRARREDGELVITMVFQSEFGGWVPRSTVAAAMPSNVVSMLRALAEFLQQE